MKEYEAEITEILQRRIKILAESEEAAYRKAKEDYKSEKIILDSNDFVEYQIDIISPKRKELQMESKLTREEALELLKKYNKEPFHIQHALTVEGVMRWYANELGYVEESDYWAITGLLHDIDFELYPEEHCKKAPELLREGGVGEDMIHAVCSHGFGICTNIKPEHEMEKVLFAVDELTGLIGAAALMRPSKSVMDMEVKSVKKKFKDKKFAAGCSRDIIQQGAENLGWNLDDMFEKTIQAMRSCEESINQEMEDRE